MEIFYSKDYKSMCRKAANIISAQVILKPDSVLGFATGSTPLGVYAQLIEWNKKGDLSFDKCRTVNLDEYCGLAPEHEQSYSYFMHKNFFDHIDLRRENVHLPNGLNSDAAAECAGYDALIESLGGIDIQLLGIGHNGHIGFNEPSDCFVADTNRVKLTESTINANARFFSSADEVPRYAYTMGIRAIVQAKRALLIATGEDKAEILYKALFGKVTPFVPASVLQLVPMLTVCADEPALSVIMKNEPSFKLQY